MSLPFHLYVNMEDCYNLNLQGGNKGTGNIFSIYPAKGPLNGGQSLVGWSSHI